MSILSDEEGSLPLLNNCLANWMKPNPFTEWNALPSCTTKSTQADIIAFFTCFGACFLSFDDDGDELYNNNNWFFVVDLMD